MRIKNYKVIGMLQQDVQGNLMYGLCEFNVEYTRDRIGESLSIQMETKDDFIGFQIPFKDLRRMINGK